MPDFHQNGSVPTLHDLGHRTASALDPELLAWGRDQPVTLIIPSLFSELGRPALQRIVDEVSQLEWLDEVVIGLDRASAAEFAHAKEFFARLPQRHHVLWHDGPRLRSIDARLASRGLAPTEPGKGRNVWYCMGHVLARGTQAIVALHDADITTYNADLLRRLVYPVAHPEFGYVFSKGFYFRAADGHFRGRVSRLLVTPLVRALKATVGAQGYLDYIDAFRYPLAGEFAMRTEVLLDIRLPSDWGLEIGVLSEVRRHYDAGQLCQVDVAGSYDHKHQDLSPDDPAAGLRRMSTDIASTMLRRLAVDGVTITPATLETLQAEYTHAAQRLLRSYRNDALMNGYDHDLAAESEMIRVFLAAIADAGQEFLATPHNTPFTTAWSRVFDVMPEVGPELIAAVSADVADA